MKYDTIVFDLDGTLLNTIEDITDSVNDVLVSEGLVPITVDEARKMVGNGSSWLVKSAVEDRLHTEMPESETSRLTSMFSQSYASRLLQKTRPYEGITELLRLLNDKGFKIGVVSNKGDANVNQLCNHFFGTHVDMALGISDDVKRKPNPDGTLSVLSHLGSVPSSTVFVGDSETDVKTAENAKIEFIGVSWGFRSKDLLLAAGAEKIIDLPCHLIHFLK